VHGDRLRGASVSPRASLTPHACSSARSAAGDSPARSSRNLNGCARLLRALVVLGCIASGFSGAQPSLQAYDGPGGVSCEFYDEALKLSWLMRGGDWVDARGIAQGAKPFSAERFESATRSMTFDVTSTFAAGASPVPGAFVLRGLSMRRGSAVFFAREHPDSAKRPRLVVRLADDRTVVIAPKSDTQTVSGLSLPCRRITAADLQTSIQIRTNSARPMNPCSPNT